MGDVQMFGNELMLRPHIVVKCDARELFDGRSIGGRCGLAVPKQCGDDDEVFLRAEFLVIPHQPEIIGDNYAWARL